MTARAANPGLPGAVSDVGRHLAAIARLEVELARVEAARKMRSFGAAAAAFATAALIGLFAVGFALAAAASGLDRVLPLWLALLVVAGGLGLVILLLVAAGLRLARRKLPPVPEKALAEAKETVRTIQDARQGNGA